jgi:hypothetical protein
LNVNVKAEVVVKVAVKAVAANEVVVVVDEVVKAVNMGVGLVGLVGVVVTMDGGMLQQCDECGSGDKTKTCLCTGKQALVE